MERAAPQDRRVRLAAAGRGGLRGRAGARAARACPAYDAGQSGQAEQALHRLGVSRPGRGGRADPGPGARPDLRQRPGHAAGGAPGGGGAGPAAGSRGRHPLPAAAGQRARWSRPTAAAPWSRSRCPGPAGEPGHGGRARAARGRRDPGQVPGPADRRGRRRQRCGRHQLASWPAASAGPRRPRCRSRWSCCSRVFGALIAAGIPLLLAITSVLTALSLLTLISRWRTGRVQHVGGGAGHRHGGRRRLLAVLPAPRARGAGRGARHRARPCGSPRPPRAGRSWCPG